MKRMRHTIQIPAVGFFVVVSLCMCGLAEDRAPANRPSTMGTAINFSFDQVDIRILAKVVSDITGRRLVVGQEIKGKITVITPTRIPVREVYPLFVSILESSGYSVIERDGTDVVVQMPPPDVAAGQVVADGDPLPLQGVVTRVFRLEYVQADDMRKMLEPLVRGGKKGSVSAFEATNHLIVTDTAESLRRVERIVGEIDKPGLQTSTEIVPLRYAAAADVATQLTLAMAKVETEGQRLARRLPRPAQGGASRSGGMAGNVVVVAAPHSNSLILVGPPPRIEDLKQIIGKLDVEPPSGHGRLSAIFLKYLSAESAAKSLNALLAKTVDKEQRQEIAIEADIANNALIVNAPPRGFDEVRTLVEQLDRAPQQVLVEVMIAEVSLGEGLDIGLDLFAGGASAAGETEVVGSLSVEGKKDDLISGIMQGLIPRGLTIGLRKGGHVDSAGNVTAAFPALLNVDATKLDSRLKILLCIPVWAQNNQEAVVNIVKNIPVLTSTIEGTGVSRDVIQNIERIDVGIKLALTPHVNPDGEILMKLNPNIEAIFSLTGQAQDLMPTIVRREVSTTVTVPDGAVIVISGLIREDHVRQLRRVPVLGYIPLLGWLFRHYSTAVERTNLLIFVAPHIVRDVEDAQRMRKALEQRMKDASERVGDTSFDSVDEMRIKPLGR